MNKAFRKSLGLLNELKGPAIAILGGLLLGGIIMLLTGYDALSGYNALVDGAFGGKNAANFYGSLVRAAPIVGLAIAASIAFKAGFMNIGGEGQMIIGAMISVIIGLYSPFSPLITFILAILGAALLSGAYAMISAWMDVRYKIPIFISTLLLNYPVNYLATFLANRPLRDLGTGEVQTRMLPKALHIPNLIPRTQFHWGILFIPVLVVVTAFVIHRTAIGYKIRMSGYNIKFLTYGGYDTTKLEYSIMFISGAISGLVGFLEVYGMRHRYIPGMLTTPLYAWTAITAAILANAEPLGVLFAGFLLAAIQNGGYGMERKSDVPREISRVIQSIIIMIVCAASGLRSKKYKTGKDVE